MLDDQFLERVSRELSHPFRSFFDEFSRSDFPSLNVSTAKDNLLITAEVPGVDPDSIDISIVGDTLTLRGERKRDISEKARILRQERPIGTFSRTMSLPYRVDVENVKARCANGILYLTLPMSEEERPRKISVQSAH